MVGILPGPYRGMRRAPKMNDLKMMKKLSTSSRGNCGHWLVRPHKPCLVCKTKHEAFTKRLTTLTSLYVHKKLHLVLDLDHTLLHSVRVSDLSKAERYLIDDGESVSREHVKIGYRLIKFRPFLHDFLKEANKLFNMSVYTKATSGYAHHIVRMIDPDKTYFGDRVITRQESPNTKTLDLVLADERGILIVDDSVDVWPNHKRNLLEITRYLYFQHHDYYLNKDSKSSSYAERKMDESKSAGALANLLKFLQEIHSEFFRCELAHELDSKDVRSMIKGPFKPHGC